MSSGHDLQAGVVGITESVHVALVEEAPTEGIQAMVLVVMPQQGATLEIVLEDEPTTEEGPSKKDNGKKRAKTPPAAQAYNDSIWEMDEKANYIQSFIYDSIIIATTIIAPTTTTTPSTNSTTTTTTTKTSTTTTANSSTPNYFASYTTISTFKLNKRFCKK
ncbi:hypothetical protein CsatB_008115 [Cannabis sativa]